MVRHAWKPAMLAIALSLCAGGLSTAGEKIKNLANAGEKIKKLKPDVSIKHLDLKPAERVEKDIDDICLRRKLLKRRHAPEVHYEPPELYGPTVDPHFVPPSSTKPADSPREPARTEPPTLPAPSVPMTFPYDGGPVRTMPRTRPEPTSVDGPVLGPTPSERMVVAPPPADKYPAYGEDEKRDSSRPRLLTRRNRR